MNKKISFPIAIVIIVVCAVLVGGFVIWQYLGIPKEEEKELSIGWQIYQRPNTIFSFRYPEKWTLDDSGTRFLLDLKNEEGEDIVIIESGDLAFYYPTSSPFCAAHPENNRCEVLKTDKYSASIDWNPESREGAIAKIVIPEEYTTEKWVLIITLYKADPSTENIFRQILTSFEFIKPTIDISNWQTYRSEEHGFEVKYPSEWKYNDTLERQIQLFPNPEIISQEIIKGREIPYFNIEIDDIPIGDRSLNLRELFNKYMLPQLMEDVDPRLQEVKVNNVDALTFFHTIVRVYVMFHPYRTNKTMKIYFHNQEAVLREITTIQTFNQMLSTFRFLE